MCIDHTTFYTVRFNATCKHINDKMANVRTFLPQPLTSVAELASSSEQSDFQRVVLCECFTRGDRQNQNTMLFTIHINKFNLAINKETNIIIIIHV